MKRILAMTATLWIAALLSGASEAATTPPVLKLPSSPEELIAYCRFDSSLSNFARHGETLTGGLQTLLLGTQVPIADGPAARWAKPYYKGRLRILAFLPLNEYADISTVYRNLDCEISFIQMPMGGWFKDIRDDLYSGYSARVAREALEKECDVILLCCGLNSGPQDFPEDIIRKVLDKVNAGTGLVINSAQIVGGGWPLKFWPQGNAFEAVSLAKPTGGRVRLNPKGFTGMDDSVLNGVPFGLLPPVFAIPTQVGAEGKVITNGGKTPPTWKYSDKPEPLPEVLKEGSDTPLIIGGNHGKGRVVATCYATQSGFPAVDGNDLRHGINRFQEYHASLVAKLLLWAGKKDSDLQLRIENTTPLQAGITVELRSATTQVQPLVLKATVRDFQFREVWTSAQRVGPFEQAQSVVFSPPPLPDGRYAFDVVARTTAGATVNWASVEVAIVAPESLNLTTDKEIYREADIVHITGQAADLGKGVYTAKLEISDSLGRLLKTESVSVDANGEFTAQFPATNLLASIHTIEAVLFRDKQPCARASRTVYCPRFGWDDFYNILWGNAEQIEINRDWAGINCYLGAGWAGHEHIASNSAKAGLPLLWTNVAPQSPEQTQKEPDKSEVLYDEQVRRVNGWLHRYGAVGVCFQDERHGFNDPEPNKECLRRFREWLPQQYGSLERLNASWETKFTSWEEVAPLLTKDFKPDQTNLAPWLDFRLFVSKLTIDIDARQAAAVRKATTPDLYIGIEGIFGLGGHMVPYSGFDYSAHSRCFNMIMPYDDEKNSVTTLACSFTSGPLTSWDGYSAPKWKYYSKPWWGALHGYWGASWFCSSTLATSTGCILPQAQWVEEGTRKLRNGVGKMLMTSELESDPVVFLYSQPSIYAAYIAGKWIDPKNQHLMNRPSTQWGRENLQRLVNEFGLQYSYMNPEQIEMGALKGTKLLVLPDVMCMSQKTATAIKQFVNNGGVAVADLCPALWDDHGHPVKPGSLDDLFGVTHDEFQFATRPVDWLVGTTTDEPDFKIRGEWFIGEYYEQSLKTTDGMALGVHIFGEKDVPAFIFKRTGKGAAVLMNFLETNYARFPEGRQRVFMRALLDLAKVETPMRVMDENGGQLYQYDITRFRDGENLYVGVYRMTLSSSLNPDSVVVQLPKSGHLYEVKSGKYLGVGDKAQVSLLSSGSVLIAILPYEVEGIAATSTSGKRGDALTVSASVKTAGRPGRHVLHIEVLDPAGNLCRAYTRNVVAENGRWEGTLPTALNDPVGRWTVRIREVVSDTETVARFSLK